MRYSVSQWDLDWKTSSGLETEEVTKTFYCHGCGKPPDHPSWIYFGSID